jgi:hypothetical protein
VAFEPGGYADKLGNRYEGRWVARQMLLLLSEQLASITLESVGDDEAGVDLWITRHDGKREAQQCKAENGTKFKWSLRDLAGRGVLSNLKMQLQRDSSCRFAFVSSTPANHLRDLSRSASHSSGDAQAFYDHQILAGSKDRKQAFSTFCELLNLSEKDSRDRGLAIDLLSRSDFHLFSDDREQHEELRWMAKQSVIGDSNAVISLLASFAEENLRRTIIATDIRTHLKQSGFVPRALFADERIEPKLEELREEFNESISPHLAGGFLIPRSEVEQLKTLLSSDKHVDAIVLHGAAGRGKSGVLYQFCRYLSDCGIPYLAVRLDRKTPKDNPITFGAKLGLPESPVNSLCAISGDRHCVLVLDQLDALRWTAAHATEGLDVCKALLREVKAMRLLGRRVTVVFSCRTYDLENDPQIKSWLKESPSFSLEKIEVTELQESSVQEFVDQFNVDFSRMTPLRKNLLRSIQNLALWAEVVNSDHSSPEFDSGSDLLRAFWKNRRQELEKAGFDPRETQRLLDAIVDYMERTASLTAPRSIVEHHEGLATELQTRNVVHIDRHTISFCHQSHLDFLIASRAINSFETTERSIIDWLGDKTQQSLFRREQLRQLLYLLADINDAKLSSSLVLLIESEDIRFHIKQLSIETAGHLRPRKEVREFVFSLLDRKDWRDHVFRDVFHGNTEWIEKLHDEGRLINMILADDSSEYGTAAWLISSVANRIPKVVDAVLDAVTNASLSERLINFLLYSDVESESDNVFQFRLATFPKAVEPPYVHWEKVSKCRPDRAIELLAACLASSPQSRENRHGGGRFIADHGNYSKAIRSAARRVPRLVVRRLLPMLRTIAERTINEHKAWRNRLDGDDVSFPNTQIPKILLTAMSSAFVALAKRHPEQFIDLSGRIDKLRSRSIQKLLLRGWSSLPKEAFADQAVEWLLADINRLRCGSDRCRPRWCEAANLIRKMSPCCSNAVFQRLERTVQGYRDPDEKKLAAWWLRYARDGYYRNGFGAATHYLLPALDPKRRSLATIGRIGVLREKFADYPKDRFLRSRSRGGMVRSPLGSDAIRRMSDSRWLRLISNQEIPTRDGAVRTYGNNSVTESSVDMFARDFGIAARREPERFGTLALRMPADAPSDYLAEVFAALQELKPPSEVTEKDRDSWQPASHELVDRILESVNLSDSSSLMRQFCWLLIRRTDLKPSDRVIQRLIELTEFMDPHYDAPDQVHPNEESSRERVHHFESVALNHVRALAVSAIGSILYEHKDLFTRLESALERILDDPHPAVRLALVGVCLPIWNFNRTIAINWFIQTSGVDLWPACGTNSQRLMNCAFPEFTEQLRPLIDAMVSSQEPSIMEEGAQEATARWLFFDVFSDLVEICRRGSVPQRKGVTKIAAQFAMDEKYAEKCLPILAEMCKDPSEKIREVTVRAFHDDRLLKIPNVSEFLLQFIESDAFDDSPDSLCGALHDFTESLTPFTDVAFSAVKRAIEIQSNPSEKPNRRIGLLDRHLIGLIMRLYEHSDLQAHGRIRDECLDAIDNMLKHRVAPARLLLEEISK